MIKIGAKMYEPFEVVPALPKRKGISFLLWVVYLFLLLTILTAHRSYSQTGNQLDVSQTGGCDGSSFQIQAITSGTFLGWFVPGSLGLTILSPNSVVSDIQPKVTTTYTAQALFLGDNSVPNGDFELGNSGFSSQYIYEDSSGFKTGVYSVTKNPFKLFAPYVKQRDHTSGQGYMLLADGDKDSTKAVYRVSIPVEANTRYEFSIWMANTHKEMAKSSPDTSISTPAFLVFSIDGVPLGQYKIPLDTVWHSFGVSWTSGAAKTISFEIKDKNVSIKGNDFVLDDISLRPLVTKQASITVKPCNTNTVFSPDGDGNADTFYIQDTGNVKIIDMDGNLVREMKAPGSWDGLKNSGEPAAMGYYAIVIEGTKVIRLSLVK